MTTEAENNWGMAAHLSALAGYVFPIIGFIIGPLVIWLMKKDEMPFVNSNGKEALNFQITMVIAAIVSSILVFVIIGIFLLWAVAIIDMIFIIVAAIQASKGVDYRYPVSLRLIK